MPSWIPLPIALAFVVSASVTPLVMIVARKFHLLDTPNGGRKLHAEPTPLLGGAAVFLAFFLSVGMVLFLTPFLTNGQIGIPEYAGFFFGALILMIGGVLDDRYQLPPKVSVLFPVAAALVASLAGIGVSKLTNPAGGFIMVAPFLSALMTFGWLLIMSYATKLLDGVDGLTASVVLTGSLVMAALALSRAFFQPDVALLSLIFAAALFGFLLWNFPQARIFLGEGGSTFLGFSLGVLSVIAGSKMVTLLLVLGVPCLDVFQVMVRRAREGRSIASGDRYHFHHLLFDAGYSERQIIAVYVLASLAFGVTTLFVSHVMKLVILALLSLVFLVSVMKLHRAKSL